MKIVSHPQLWNTAMKRMVICGAKTVHNYPNKNKLYHRKQKSKRLEQETVYKKYRNKLKKLLLMTPRKYYKLHLGPLLLTWFNFNPSMVSNHIHYKMWDEITYPFLNFNGAAVEV